ncbi:MAG: heavy metal translocating P-type ATPase [Phycisphaerales bacterium]|nr:heavy metal translocating P-type ATPase [Phycisphaerales bacterium]
MTTETLQLEAVAAPITRAACVACTHCGLPVPRGLVRASVDVQFCCGGCEGAYGVINSCGLGGYYELMARTGDHGLRSLRVSEAFAEFDDPAFAAAYIRPAEAEGPVGAKRLDLVLEGMHCAACVWLLEHLPRIVPGVLSATVYIGRSTVSVAFDPQRVAPSRIAGALATLGYTPHAPRGNAARDAVRVSDRKQLVQIAVAGACAGNVMLFSFALYGGFFGGSMSATIEGAFRWLSLVVGCASLAGPGRAFFKGAWASIRAGTPSIDAPIALALLAGGLMGLFNTVLNRGEIYFDSLTMLVFLLLVGRFFGARQQRIAASSVELLFCLTSGSAWVVDPHGGLRRVPIEAIAAGDAVEVRPGESVPVDGRVTSGRTSIDQAMLTGESRPVWIGEGGDVLAGTVNQSATIRVRATATGRQTRAGRLMELVERCATRRPAIVRFADSIARPFVVVVSIVAVAVGAAWWFVDPAHAVDHAVALLIVTCPCALGFAAPLAVHAAIGQGARSGILIKDGEVLERLARPGLILLDKTGTLTEGHLRVVSAAGDRRAMHLAAALEREATHPIAAALREAYETGLTASRVEQTDQGGICGEVDGHRVAVGNEAFVMGRSGHALPRGLANVIEQARADLQTPTLIALDGVPSAVVVLGDRLRSDAAESVAALKGAGWRVGILSGDEPAIVAGLSVRLGLDPADCSGGVGPEEKAAYVRQRMTAGPVVMVGDGVNDAAALATATVGIAVHGGAEASMAAADAYVARPGLAPIVTLVRSGPRMIATVKRIFAASLAYNIAAGSLAAAGLIHPVVAAVLMPLSSLTVVAIALRSRVIDDHGTLREGGA